MSVIYAMADQHGHLGIEVPPCDLLLHAGDVCRDFNGYHGLGLVQQEEWFSETWMPWFERQPVKQCLLTWGNHDFIFVRQYGKAAEIVRIDESVDVVIDGTVKKVWLSPWSKEYNGWAWMKEEADLGLRYNEIPLDTDIVVTHQPPYGYGDRVREKSTTVDPHKGSTALLYAIERVKPAVVICGHIHEGYGEFSHTVRCWEDSDRGIQLRTHVIRIYNVSVVDAKYQLVRGPTRIEL